MKGSQIVLAGEPRGIFEEGICDTADIYPGTVVELDATVTMESGRPHFKAGSATSKGALYVARESELSGSNWETAYAVGDRIFVYCPADGEDLNMRVIDTAGTGTNIVRTAGGTLVVSTGGKLDTGSTPATDPFQLMEDVDEATNVAWCKYRGK